jgi:hypothetical protein
MDRVMRVPVTVPVPPVWLLSAIFAAAARVALADPEPAPELFQEPSLWDAQVRAGYGVDLDGGQGPVGARPSPLTVQAAVSIAVVEVPRLYGYGGMMVETLNRGSVGAIGGIELRPDGSAFHVAGGGTWVFDPYTLWGATASAGACSRKKGKLASFCGDLQLTAYFAGSDLGMKRDDTQIQFALGVKFDAL